MIGGVLKRAARLLSEPVQADLKRLHYRRQMRRGQFTPDEPEAAHLGDWIGAGDWVIDVGANVGHYSRLFSELVGPNGRVLSFEPVPSTFALLAANALLFPHGNVTALGVAATDATVLLGMQLPVRGGAPNPYEAAIRPGGTDAEVMGLPIDCLAVDHPVRLVKIDAEGHELQVLKGMTRLLGRDHPTLIVEGADPAVVAFLAAAGYRSRRLAGSPNTIYEAGVADAAGPDRDGRR